LALQVGSKADDFLCKQKMLLQNPKRWKLDGLIPEMYKSGIIFEERLWLKKNVVLPLMLLLLSL
jgi:hypothetical protein